MGKRRIEKGSGAIRQTDLSSVREGTDLLILSDIHLSHTAPAARAGEADWYAAMKRTLDNVKEIHKKVGEPSILCAGDIFDRWNSPPQLINFAIENLPKMFAIPGQHDLPLHNIEDIERSAYWTLCKAGVITHLAEEAFIDEDFYVQTFPFGTDVKPAKKTEDFSVCLIHKYVWWKDSSYPGAPPSCNYGKLRSIFNTYDLVCIGDNHKGWQQGHVLNCGTLMRRKTDEFLYQPSIGLYNAEEGTVTRVLLDTKEDVLAKSTEEGIDISDNGDVSKFVQELEKLGLSELDFLDALEQYIQKNSVVRQVSNVLREVIDEYRQ